MAIVFNDNIQFNTPKLGDNKKGIFSGGVWRPFNDVAEANATVLFRARCQVVNVLKDGVPTDYWWRDGITDNDLIEKTQGAGITIDAVPTDGSTNAVSSNGVFDALATKQALDSDLTTIAGLTPANDDFIQRKADAWANRTVAQVKTDLGVDLTLVELTDSITTIAWNFSEGNVGQVHLTETVATRDINVSNVSGIKTGILEVIHDVPGTSIILPGISTGVAFSTDVYNLAAGTGVTLLGFYFNGVNFVWTSSINVSTGGDTEAPVLQELRILTSTPTQIVATYNELLLESSTPDVGDFVISSPSRTVTSVVVTGMTVLININTSFSGGDAPTCAYTGGTNKIKDLSGNIAANFSGESIILGDADPVDWTAESLATDAGSGILLFDDGVANGGALGVQKLNNSVGSYLEWKIPTPNTLSNGCVMVINGTIPGSYTYAGSYKVALYNIGTTYFLRVSSTEGAISGQTCANGDILRFEITVTNTVAIKKSINGGLSFSTMDTATDALLGLTDMYIVAMNAIAGTDKRLLDAKIKNV